MSSADSNAPRRATTLATYCGPEGPEDTEILPWITDPEVDARVDLHLAAHRVRTALAQRGTAAATARLAKLTDPGLWTGAVQDGTFRGLMVALEEAESLCRPIADSANTPDAIDADQRIASGQSKELNAKDLRKQREFAVAAGSARVRFSRRHGLLLVDRATDLHVEDCLHFEDQEDVGDLDRFEGSGRPRYFRPSFLKPERFAQTTTGHELVLVGRLGRRPDGIPCRIELFGSPDHDAVRLRVAVHNQRYNHRLRVRFHSVPRTSIRLGGSPGVREVRSPSGHGFVAATLVRAVGHLRVGDTRIDTPAAQCVGWVRHEFWLGGERAR